MLLKLSRRIRPPSYRSNWPVNCALVDDFLDNPPESSETSVRSTSTERQQQPSGSPGDDSETSLGRITARSIPISILESIRQLLAAQSQNENFSQDLTPGRPVRSTANARENRDNTAHTRPITWSIRPHPRAVWGPRGCNRTSSNWSWNALYR